MVLGVVAVEAAAVAEGSHLALQVAEPPTVTTTSVNRQPILEVVEFDYSMGDQEIERAQTENGKNIRCINNKRVACDGKNCRISASDTHTAVQMLASFGLTT